MLRRQQIWVPLLTHQPLYPKALSLFLQNGNRHSAEMLKTIDHRPENARVLLMPDSKAQRDVAYALAFPFTVSDAMCDHGDQVSLGCFTSLVDTTTSLHVMERLLPSKVLHVSVSMQTNLVHPVRAGEKVVLVCRLDKLGKRLSYSSVELFQDKDEVDAATAQEEQKAKTVNDVEKILRHYSTLANGKHVKCIL